MLALHVRRGHSLAFPLHPGRAAAADLRFQFLTPAQSEASAAARLQSLSKTMTDGDSFCHETDLR